MSNIKITDINYDDIENIYQFQLEPNKNYGYLVHVGKIKTNSDILISRFTINNDICNIVSCIYSEKEIMNINNNLTLIKADYYKDELPTHTVLCNFIINDDIELINNITTDNNNKIKIYGNFFISYTENDTIKQLYKYNKNPTNEKMIEKCVQSLVDVLNM